MTINTGLISTAAFSNRSNSGVASAVRPDCIIATGRSDYPNQVNNVLCFPFIFRGALDVGATGINDAMQLACIDGIAALARATTSAEAAAAYQGEQLTFGADYFVQVADTAQPASRQGSIRQPYESSFTVVPLPGVAPHWA